MSGTLDVDVWTSPIYTYTGGPAYTPFVAIGFSEVVSVGTFTTQTVRWVDDTGRTILGSATYDEMLYQVVVASRQLLQAGTVYTVSVTRGVKD